MASLLNAEIKGKLLKAMQQELYAHGLYKSIANQMQSMGYFGAQKYFLKESKEELKHYQLLADYMNDRGDVATIGAGEGQFDEATSLRKSFEFSYEAEHDLENFYANFYKQALLEVSDIVTAQFLLQFIEIQRKSVGEVKDILSLIELTKDNPSALLLVDEKLDEWGK